MRRRPLFPTVFLDRDGVINENRPDHVKRWDEFQFIAGAPQAIARLSHAGVRVFVVSNQAIVNRGLVSADDVDAINDNMVEAIERAGGRIAGIAYCPHRPEEACACRKPQPGLLLRLATAYGIDLSEAVVIGDALSDLEAGRAVGCTTMLVLTGRGRDQLVQARARGWDHLQVAGDLTTATDMLLSAAHKQAQPNLNAPASWIEPRQESNTHRTKAGRIECSK